MAAFNSLQREYKGMFSDPRAFIGDEAARLDDVDRQNAFKSEQAVLDKRKAAQKMLGEQQTGETNKRLFGSYMAGELNRPKWTAEITGAEKPTSESWWAANDQQANAVPSSTYDPRSVGTHIMGRGDNFDDQTSPYRILSGLSGNRTPQINANAGGGGASTPAGSLTREIKDNSGQTIGHGPDPFAEEKLKQMQIQTRTAEQNVPSEARERARNETNYDIGSGQLEREARATGDIARDEHYRNRRAVASELNDPTIYSSEVMTPEYYAQEAYGREIKKIEAAAEANARGLRERGRAAVDLQEMKNEGIGQKAVMDAFTKASQMPQNTPDEKTARLLAIAQVISAAQAQGLDLRADPQVKAIIDSLQGGPNQTPAGPPRVRSGNSGYDAQQNSLR